MQRKDVLKVATSADTDVLAGSALDPCPANGFLRVFAASTVNTADIAIEPANHANPTGPGTQDILLRANGEPRSYDPHWETAVSKGEKISVAVSGTTGTYYVWASFVGGE